MTDDEAVKVDKETARRDGGQNDDETEPEAGVAS